MRRMVSFVGASGGTFCGCGRVASGLAWRSFYSCLRKLWRNVRVDRARTAGSWTYAVATRSPMAGRARAKTRAERSAVRERAYTSRRSVTMGMSAPTTRVHRTTILLVSSAATMRLCNAMVPAIPSRAAWKATAAQPRKAPRRKYPQQVCSYSWCCFSSVAGTRVAHELTRTLARR